MKFRLLFSAIVMMLLASCGHFKDGTSVWSGGLWIILVIGIGGTIASTIRGILQTRSGSERLRSSPDDPGEPNLPNLPFWKVRGGQLAIVLFILTIIFIIAVNGTK